MQTPDDFLRWIEILAAALAGLGAWIWRVSAKMQSYEERLVALQAAVKSEQNKRSTRDGMMFARLEDMRVTQAVQGAKIDNIEKTCAETNQAILEILADRLPGGNRKGDPPGRE